MRMATQSWRDSYRGMSSDNIKGLVLALSSSVFIGASFIVKKKGLKKAGASGVRAGIYTFIFVVCVFLTCWFSSDFALFVGVLVRFDVGFANKVKISHG